MKQIAIVNMHTCIFIQFNSTESECVFRDMANKASCLHSPFLFFLFYSTDLSEQESPFVCNSRGLGVYILSF